MHLQSVTLVWRPVLFLIAMLPIRASAYEPDAILTVDPSPDGRFLAVGYASGELGVINLESPEATRIYSRAIPGGSFAWSSDSLGLAFVEQLPDRPAVLWIVRLEESAPPQAVLEGADWKARPAWVDSDRILFLSDRDSDHINLWQFDLASGEADLVLNLADDISGLWVAPVSGEALAASTDGRATKLLRRSDDGSRWDRMPHDGENEFFSHRDVVFSPLGRSTAYLTLGPQQNDLWVLDLNSNQPLGRLRMPTPPGGMALAEGSSMLLEFDGKLHRWDYLESAETGRRSSEVTEVLEWNGPAFSRPFARQRNQWGAVIGDNIVMSAHGFGSPSEARFHARSVGDLVNLGLAWQSAGDTRQARRTLEDLWEIANSRPARGEEGDGYRIAIARTQMERRDRNPRRAAEWIERASALTGGDGALVSATAREHILLTFFDRRNVEAAAKLMEELPAEVMDSPLPVWIESLMDGNPQGPGPKWQDIGFELRRANWKDAARLLADWTREEPVSVPLRQGVALLLQGELEPLNALLHGSPPEYEALLAIPEMQFALLELSKRDLTAEMDRENLRGQLLLHWAKTGQREAARSLVARDLRDPEGSSLDYLDMLDRFLEPEELDQWMELAVGEILLSPRIVPLLDRHMLDTRAHLVFRLAKAKQELIEGNTEKLDDELLQIENDLALIPADFWDRETAKLLMLPRLFRAKYFERLGYWGSAMGAYEGCFEIIHRFPGEWGMYAFELAWARTLIAEGRGNPEELNFYLQLVRGLGDPLINPAHEESTVRAGLTNLTTLESQTLATWLPPFLRYARGVSLEQLDRPYASLAMLRQARAGEVPAGLKARVLVEEAAVRSSLGQYRLSVDLLTELCGLDLPPSALAVAIQNRAQAERQAGLIESQENRIRYLCHELGLPFQWSRTLIAGHTVLPLETAP